MQLTWLKNYNLLIYESIDSTSSEALRLAKSGVDCNFVVCAAKQTAGRGSKGRSWSSIYGNMHASILVQDDFKIERKTQLPFLVANSLRTTLQELSLQSGIDIKIELKWPNDILINDKKLAGTLIESIFLNNKQYIVIGVGVNILEAPIDAGKYNATSLYDEGIILDHYDQFLYPFMNQFDQDYNLWRQSNGNEVIENWLKYAHQLGRVITIDDGRKRMSGVFKAISNKGEMVLSLTNGEECLINAGDLLQT